MVTSVKKKVKWNGATFQGMIRKASRKRWHPSQDFTFKDSCEGEWALQMPRLLNIPTDSKKFRGKPAIKNTEDTKRNFS